MLQACARLRRGEGTGILDPAGCWPACTRPPAPARVVKYDPSDSAPRTASPVSRCTRHSKSALVHTAERHSSASVNPCLQRVTTPDRGARASVLPAPTWPSGTARTPTNAARVPTSTSAVTCAWGKAACPRPLSGKLNSSRLSASPGRLRVDPSYAGSRRPGSVRPARVLEHVTNSSPRPRRWPNCGPNSGSHPNGRDFAAGTDPV